MVLSAFSYALPCTARALSYFPHRLREGIFIRVDGDDGVGMGEYAPLVGIHSMQIADAIVSVKNFSLAKWYGALCDAKEVADDELVSFFSNFPPLIGYLLSMVHFHRSTFTHERCARGTLKLAALIESEEASSAIALAQTYGAQGFRHIKIKTGLLPIDEEIRKIKTIASVVGSRVKLRLDANRRLSFAEASSLLKGLKRVPLEYVEEPTHEINRLADLWQDHQVNLAIDESLVNVDDLSWLITSKISHVIIKPGRFVNLYVTFKLVKEAKRLGLTPILSHCFESEFSSAIFALMIDKLQLNDSAHGIMVDGVFRQGVFIEPLRAFRGQLSVENAAMLSRSPFLGSRENFTPIIGHSITG
jgi:o-succinylbenzoate synthase